MLSWGHSLRLCGEERAKQLPRFAASVSEMARTREHWQLRTGPRARVLQAVQLQIERTFREVGKR